MSTSYYDFSAAVNGTGTSASPFNLTGWTATTVSAGNSYLFKRGTTFTGTLTLTAGTNASSKVTYGAWYNSDGTDDVTQPKPVFIVSSTLSTYSSTNKDYVTLDNLDIRGWGIPLASDTCVVFCGTGTTVSNCAIYANVGCVGCFAKSNVTVIGNSLYGVGATTAHSNCVINGSDAGTATGVIIKNNFIYHLGGGSSTSHAVRLECTNSAGSLGLTFDNNIIGPAPEDQRVLPGFGIICENRSFQHMVPGVGVMDDRSVFSPTLARPFCSNKNAIGLWVTRIPSGVITNNFVSGMLTGIFMNGGGANTACTFGHNTCIYNRHFGIHLSTKAIGCTVEYNTCSYNGTSIADEVLQAYGRGIEFSSAAGQGQCGNHIVRYNTTEYNKNYGGPSDNGSEGVGIGLDDSTFGCTVYGNTIRFNEGNGVQYYGGLSTDATITDTYNHVVGNFFYSNCTASFTNRRSGGLATNLFAGHINLANTKGTTSYIANNVFAGATLCAIIIDSTSRNLTISNNIFVDVPHCIALPAAGMPSGCKAIRNDFYSHFVAEQTYATTAVNGSGVMTYPNSLYSGTDDFTFDPLIDSNYKPSAVSPAINAGLTVGAFYDYTNHAFDTPPTIGMYELFGANNTYYVGTAGNDSNNGRTTATALLTISRGAQLAVAGDIVRVLPGNYQGPIYISNDGTYQSGSSAFPITLQSDTLLGAKVRALVSPANDGSHYAAIEIRASNWILHGFEITGEDGYTNTADTSWNFSSTTEWLNGVFLTGTNNIVRYCYIHDMARGTWAAAQGGAGINMDYHYGGNTNRAYWNTIIRIGSAATPYVNGISMAASACEAMGNLVGTCNAGAGVAAIGPATNVNIANNTIFNANAGVMWGQSGASAAAPWLRNSVAFNNIVQDCSAGLLENGNIGASNLFSTNLLFGCTTNVAATTTLQSNVSATPTFVNYVSTGGGDYHLSAGSSAINGGTASVAGVLALTTDIDGTSRSSTTDIGAYEFYTTAAAAVVVATQLDRRTRRRIRRH